MPIERTSPTEYSGEGNTCICTLVSIPPGVPQAFLASLLNRERVVDWAELSDDYGGDQDGFLSVEAS